MIPDALRRLTVSWYDLQDRLSAFAAGGPFHDARWSVKDYFEVAPAVLVAGCLILLAAPREWRTWGFALLFGVPYLVLVALPGAAVVVIAEAAFGVTVI